jgi:hypothetical protein
MFMWKRTIRLMTDLVRRHISRSIDFLLFPRVSFLQELWYSARENARDVRVEVLLLNSLAERSAGLTRIQELFNASAGISDSLSRLGIIRVYRSNTLWQLN